MAVKKKKQNVDEIYKYITSSKEVGISDDVQDAYDYITGKTTTYKSNKSVVVEPKTANIAPVTEIAAPRTMQELAQTTIANKEEYEERMKLLKEYRSDARKDNFKNWAAKVGTQLQPKSPENDRLLETLIPAHKESKAKKDNYDSQIDQLKQDYDNQKTARLSETLKDPEISALVESAYESKKLVDNVYANTKTPQGQKTPFSNSSASEATKKYEESYKKLEALGLDSQALIDLRTREKNAETQAAGDAWTDNLTEEHPVIATGLSVAANMQAGMKSLPKFVEGALKEHITGEPYFVDTNAPEFALQNFRDQTRETTGNMINRDIDNKTLAGITNFAYQTGTSILDWASLAWLPQPVALAIMGTNAGTSAAKEATLNGVSGGDALLTGLAAGAAEAVFEKLSLDNFNALKATGKPGIKNRVLDILKQSFTEGTEEGFTDIANTITDNLINGGMSSYNTAIKKYIASGMSEEEAQQAASKDFGKQLFTSFAGGALSGGVIGSAGAGINSMNTSNLGRDILNDPNAYSVIKSLSDTGMNADANSDSYRLASKMGIVYQKAGFSGGEVGNLYNAVQTDSYNTTRDSYNAPQDSPQMDLSTYTQEYHTKLLKAGTREPVASNAAPALAKVAMGIKPTPAEVNAIYGDKNSRGLFISATDNEVDISTKLLDLVRLSGTKETQPTDGIADYINPERSRFSSESKKRALMEELKALRAPEKENVASQGDKDRFMLVGKDENGIEEYKTSARIQSMTANERKKELVHLIRDEYRGKTARLQKEGTTYYAQLDKYARGKGIYGDKKSDRSGYKAKINVGADGGYFDLVENTVYSGTKEEQGKATQAHRDVKNWDYFQKTITVDGNYFDVLVNVRDKGNSQYVYDVTVKENGRSPKQQQPENRSAFNQGKPTNTNISQSNKGVNTHSMPKTGSYVKSPYKPGVTIETNSSLTALQKAQIETIDFMVKDAGIPVALMKGIHTSVDAIALYNPRNNTIYVNSDKVGDALGYVIGHECVHWIKANNPAGYKKIEKIAISSLKENANFDLEAHTATVQDTYFKTTKKYLTEEEVIEEIVANSCFDVFTNEDVIAQVAKEDVTLAQQIKNWFSDFLQKLKEAAQKFNEKMGNYAEYKALNESVEALQSINQTFRDVLADTKNTATDGSEARYMINPNFNKEYDNWNKKKHVTFEVGNTSSALHSVGVKQSKIYWDATKILKIQNKHTGMTDNVIKQVPYILEHPIIVLQSLRSDSRITMFGNVLDGNGKPVLAVLELTPTDNGGIVLDEIKIASAYGKDNAQSTINRSRILYVEPDKKRTYAWLKSIQLQLPSSLTEFGSIDRIAYKNESVNTHSMLNDEKNTQKYMLPAPDASNTDQKAYENTKMLLKENETLKEKIELLKKELTITKGHELNKTYLTAIARNALKRYESSYDLTMFAEEINDLYLYIANSDSLSWDNVIYQMQKLGKKVLQESSHLNNEVWQETKPVRDYLRNTGISLSEPQKKEVEYYYGSYENFRKSMFSNVRFSEKGVPLDSIWSELTGMDGGYYLEADTVDLDQPMVLSDFLESVKPFYENRFLMDMNTSAATLALELYDAYFDTPEIHTFADKKKQELYRLRGESRRKTADFKYEYSMRTNERFVELRKQYMKKTLKKVGKEKEASAALRGRLYEKQERINRLQSHYADTRKNERIRRRKSKAKQRIVNYKEWFDKKLVNPTDTTHFPKELVKSAAEVCELINLDTGRTTPDGGQTKAKAALLELYAKYGWLKSDPDYAYQSEFDEDFQKTIEYLAETVDGKAVRDFSEEELENVANIMKELKHMFQRATKLINMDERRNIYEFAESIDGEISGFKDSANVLTEKYNLWALKPMRAVRLMSNYKDDTAFVKLFENLERGEDKAKKINMDGMRLFDPVVEGNKENKKELTVLLREFTGNHAVWESTALDDGRTVRMTRAMRVMLYLLSKNEDAMRHISNGGVTIPNETAYKGIMAEIKDTAKAIAYKSKYGGDFYRNAKNVRLTIEDVNRITNEMTQYEQDFAEIAEQFFNVFTKGHINETSMQLVGYKKAIVKNYAPLRTDRDYTNVSYESIVRDASLESWGSLKSRTGATNPIYLEDVTEAISRQLSNTAMYAGLAIPIRNFNKVTKIKFISYGESPNGDPVINYDGSVVKSIHDKFGKPGLAFTEKLLADLQNARKREFDFTDRIRSNFATAVLTANPGVALKQLAAWPATANTLGWKPLARAMLDKQSYKKVDKDLVAKYTPQLWYHNRGYASREVGDLREQNKWQSKMPGANWIAAMESTITEGIWHASEHFVRDHFSELEAGTDAYYKKVAEWFDKAMKETQSNYSVMERPESLRSPNRTLGFLVMFKTQNLQNFGMLFDSVGNLNAKHDAYKAEKSEVNHEALNKAQKELALSVSSYVVQSAFFALLELIKSLAFHMLDKYKDEDDELTGESVLKQFGKDVLETFAGSFLFGEKIYDAVVSMFTDERYYGLSDPIVEKINDFANSAVGLSNIGKNYEKDGLMGAIKPINRFICETIELTTGFPIRNIEKYILGLVDNLIDALNQTWPESDVRGSLT